MTAPDRIVLVLPGTLPMTSSGKIQRALVAKALTEGTLESLHAPDVGSRAPLWPRTPTTTGPATAVSEVENGDRLPEPVHEDADRCVLGGPPDDGEAVEHLVEAEPLR